MTQRPCRVGDTVALHDLIKRLDAIAALNSDEFVYTITVHQARKKDGFVYMLYCREKANQHCFVSGAGRSLEEACEIARGEIPEACVSWNYQDD